MTPQLAAAQTISIGDIFRRDALKIAPQNPRRAVAMPQRRGSAAAPAGMGELARVARLGYNPALVLGVVFLFRKRLRG